MLSCSKWLLLVSLFWGTVLHAQPLQKTFSNWQVTCNNLNSCEARSFPGNDGLTVTVSRDAGEDDRPALRIDYGSHISGDRGGGALRDNLLLDGQRLTLDLKHWQVAPHHLMTGHAVSINEFLAQVRDADSLTLLYRPDAAVSLRGLKAALLLMDDVQGRVNSSSAWIRRGDRPLSEVPPAPELPQVSPPPHQPSPLSAEETRDLIDFAGLYVSRDSCSLNPNRREIAVSPLTDEKALLLIGCEMGAWNLIDLAFEVTREPPYMAKTIQLILPFSPSDRGSRQLELINTEYNASRGELMTFSKTRGLGDCGVATRWQYNGREFVLAEYTQENTCDAWNSSDRWPTLWVSRQAAEPRGSVKMEVDQGDSE